MPANLFMNMNSHGGGLEEQRALQIARELSRLDIDGSRSSPTAEDPTATVTTLQRNAAFENTKIEPTRKSANMTERVPVPSSEHVAEIVGRQGCKIKALRAKTNTYIKTPVRGEEPIFMVTGRREDVMMAKREILSAADHFSQIRASRRNNSVSSCGSGGSVGGGGGPPPGPPSPGAPGQVTIEVRVPYRVVGLVVGPKGATIKRIQQQTHTYIVTPSRDRDPVFEVTGLAESVQRARTEIESHIVMRTGGLADRPPPPDRPPAADFHSNGVEAHDSGRDLLGSMYALPSLNSAFSCYSDVLPSVFPFPPPPADTAAAAAAAAAAGATYGLLPPCDSSDEGIASPPYDTALTPTLPSIWSDVTPAPGVAPDMSALFTPISAGGRHKSCASHGGAPRTADDFAAAVEHASVRRIHSDPLVADGGATYVAAVAAVAAARRSVFGGSSGSVSTSPTDSTGSGGGQRGRHCCMCAGGAVVAALVPCGHNVFCMECANLIVGRPETDRHCPVCQLTPTQAIRIFS